MAEQTDDPKSTYVRLELARKINELIDLEQGLDENDDTEALALALMARTSVRYPNVLFRLSA